jgi:hypothetical protein
VRRTCLKPSIRLSKGTLSSVLLRSIWFITESICMLCVVYLLVK